MLAIAEWFEAYFMPHKLRPFLMKRPGNPRICALSFLSITISCQMGAPSKVEPSNIDGLLVRFDFSRSRWSLECLDGSVDWLRPAGSRGIGNPAFMIRHCCFCLCLQKDSNRNTRIETPIVYETKENWTSSNHFTLWMVRVRQSPMTGRHGFSFHWIVVACRWNNWLECWASKG
jgi:hypothetical protein